MAQTERNDWHKSTEIGGIVYSETVALLMRRMHKLKEERKHEDFKLQKAPKVMEDFEEDQVLIEKTLEYDLENEETYNKESEEVEEYYYLER